ncbi:MAG: methyltransferase domain-containing protein [Candidatus Aenigmarchaeota archaeon]|nr:methyltransferase domain-containing protein [Candidatus Aenigmarchaeota archaeon]
MDGVKKLYDAWSKEYDTDAYWDPAIQMEKDLLVPLLGVKRNDVILDIGCGTGRLTVALASMCNTIIGIDFSEHMLIRAQEKTKNLHHVEYKKTDIEKRLPFKNSSFDKVICSLVVNHIKDINKFFHEINRVLKRDGVFVFDECIPDTPYFQPKKINLLYRTDPKGTKVFANHSIGDYVNQLHRSHFSIAQAKFLRFDDTIKHTLMKACFEKNKGRTFGMIFKAVKD